MVVANNEQIPIGEFIASLKENDIVRVFYSNTWYTISPSSWVVWKCLKDADGQSCHAKIILSGVPILKLGTVDKIQTWWGWEYIEKL